MIKKTNNKNIGSYAALGCFVLLTTPPQSADKPYFGVRIARETEGRLERYSPTYKCADPEQAKSLADEIAKDRGNLKVIVRAAPEHPVLRPPTAK